MMKECVIKEGTVKADGMEIADGYTRLVFPSSVREIDDFAFFGNGTIEELVLNEGLEKIGVCAFRECRALKNVVIPASVKEIGSSAFMDCTSLESVVFSGGGPEELETEVFCNCKALKKVVLGPSLRKLSTGTEIGGTFEGCIALEEIELPEGCEVIGCAAFRDCEKLSRINFPSTLKGVGEESLACTAIGEIVLSEGLLTFWNAVYGCEKLTRIVLPSTVQSLSYKVFGGLPNLNEVVLPKKFEEDLDLYFKREDLERIHIRFI